MNQDFYVHRGRNKETSTKLSTTSSEKEALLGYLYHPAEDTWDIRWVILWKCLFFVFF